MYNPDVQSSTQKAFFETILKWGGKFKNSILLHNNMGSTLGLQDFTKVYPDRIYNFGNSIDAMISAACGMTIRGKIPVVCSVSDALTGKNWQTIRSLVCYPNLNIKFIGSHAGILSGPEGAGEQALEDVGIMRILPNMKVLCPGDANETKKVVEMMLLDYGPTYVRLGHLPLPEIYDEEHTFEFGKAHIYKSGSDVCIFSYGTTLHTALDAAQILEREHISTMVVNMASIKPLDEGLVVECAHQIPHLVTVEDHLIQGGLGSAVAEVLSDKYPAKVLRLGMKSFGESGNVDDLYKKYRLDGIGIAEQIMEKISKR